MKTLTITKQDVPVSNGRLDMLLMALCGKEVSPSSPDDTFADILSKKKGTGASPAFFGQKKAASMNEKQTLGGFLSQRVVSDGVSESHHPLNPMALFQSDEQEIALLEKLLGSASTDETPFSAFVDIADTERLNLPCTASMMFPLHEEDHAPAIPEGPEHRKEAFTPGQAAKKDHYSLSRLGSDSRPSAPPSSRGLDMSSLRQGTKDRVLPVDTEASHTQRPATGTDTNEKMDNTTVSPIHSPSQNRNAASIVAATQETEKPLHKAVSFQKESLQVTLNLPTIENKAQQSSATTSAAGDRGNLNITGLPKNVPARDGQIAPLQQTREPGLHTGSSERDSRTHQHQTKTMQHPDISKLPDRTEGVPAPKEGAALANGMISQIRPVAASRHNDYAPEEPMKRVVAPAPIKYSLNNERQQASKPLSDERSASLMELPQRAVTMNPEGDTAGVRDGYSDKNHTPMTARTANPEPGATHSIRSDSFGTILSAEAKMPLPEIQAGSRTQAIINQIIEAKQSMNGDFGRIRIILSPPNLGTVDLEIMVRNERVEVVMTADNSSVQQALQSRADDMRVALQRHDLKIDSFQILMQDQQAGHNESQGGALFNQKRDHRPMNDYMEDDAQPPFSAPPDFFTIRERNGHNGRVSIFV